MVEQKNIPAHIAIIMDGNGRWAKERGLPRVAGHKVGTERVKEIVRAAKELGIKVVTLFAFSTENWSRPKKEIDTLMRYFREFLSREVPEMCKHNVKFRIIGNKRPLPENLVAKIREVEEKTQYNTGITLVIAVNYGARQEILAAAKKFTQAVVKGLAKVEDLDEITFRQYLYTADLPDPDLLIRTSGEARISNFLLWQVSYAELYFIKKYWPDFKKQDLMDAVLEYQRRQRRFGDIVG